eukprot:gene9511-10501_t
MLGKRRGPQCSAFGCSKRKKTGQRSDSEGSSDEESSVKRQFQRTFHLQKKYLVGKHPSRKLEARQLFADLLRSFSGKGCGQNWASCTVEGWYYD